MKGAAVLAVLLFVVGLGMIYIGWTGQSGTLIKAVTG